MSFWSYLYTLIFSPLELLFEFVFSIANKMTGNIGVSIVFLSLTVNLLCLPLYNRADKLQAEERDIQAKMAHAVKHIKKQFKGDERFFMLQEYYRINHYKPIYALKSSFSLLLQIPFFIAAYNLLSNMKSLQGMPFGFISDLGKEDAMFMIGNFPINVLPILMTLINIVSGMIYTKGHQVKDKIQVYGLAAVFLVLLYHSPSGLVIYWLLNNVFSLAKNIVYKTKKPKMVLYAIFAIADVIILFGSVARSDFDIRQKVVIALRSVLLCVPIVTDILKNKIDFKIKSGKKNTSSFFAGTVLMALITGFLIPSAVIKDSTMEFIDVVSTTNPVFYIVNAMCLSFGSWVLWGGIFYFFMSENTKAVFCKAIWIICGVSVLDYMLFGTKLGNLSSELKFDNDPSFTITEYALNTLAVIALIVIFGLIYTKWSKITKSVLIAAAIPAFILGAWNIAAIIGCYVVFFDIHTSNGKEPVIPLSKNGQNVVVLMLDRAMGTQVPYIFNEKPELLEEFDGFTYYPNTISYGAFTNVGSPVLYGGYEYTPENMNKRTGESLKSKHNEALKVMPVLFGNNGYNVTICNPTYAGYQWIPDLSIYDDYPDFYCYNVNGLFSIFDSDDYRSSVDMSLQTQKIRNRNFFCYSLMKISPVLLQETLYDGGRYNESYSSRGVSEGLANAAVIQTVYDLSRSTGYSTDFIESYAVLDNLPNITVIDDSANNNFFMMSNDTTHSECLLQKPDYVPVSVVDNTQYDIDMVARYTIDGRTMNMNSVTQVTHYHVNMAAFLKLGEWFDYLRENGVYDNTRIIIVSDHGRNLGQFNVSCNGEDMEFFMPLLMVKDFNASGFTVSEEFMTNGDTPTIATAGIIRNTVNPFTGKPINSDSKNGPQKILFLWDQDLNDNRRTVFNPGSWYTFAGGNPYDQDNWKYSGDY